VIQFLFRPLVAAYRAYYLILGNTSGMGDEKVIAVPVLVVPGKVRAVPAGPEPVVAWPVRGLPPSRHGAISRKLFTYTNYKAWAEKTRESWAAEEPDPTDVTQD